MGRMIRNVMVWNDAHCSGCGSQGCTCHAGDELPLPRSLVSNAHGQGRDVFDALSPGDYLEVPSLTDMLVNERKQARNAKRAQARHMETGRFIAHPGADPGRGRPNGFADDDGSGDDEHSVNRLLDMKPRVLDQQPMPAAATPPSSMPQLPMNRSSHDRCGDCGAELDEDGDCPDGCDDDEVENAVAMATGSHSFDDTGMGGQVLGSYRQDTNYSDEPPRKKSDSKGKSTTSTGAVYLDDEALVTPTMADLDKEESDGDGRGLTTTKRKGNGGMSSEDVENENLRRMGLNAMDEDDSDEDDSDEDDSDRRTRNAYGRSATRNAVYRGDPDDVLPYGGSL